MKMPLNTPLPANLPENWTYGQIIAPTGQEVGLPANYGYNYLMSQVNNSQRAALELEQKKAELDMSNVTQASTAQYNLGTKPRQNLLDNWYFVGGGTAGNFPINQRGKQSYTTTTNYGIDRWYVASAGEVATYHITETGLAIDRFPSGLEYVDFKQRGLSLPENIKNGEQLTASILIGTQLYSGSFLFDSSKSNYVFFDSKFRFFTNTAENSNPVFRFYSEISDIKAVKLERGSTQTLARQLEDDSWEILEKPDYHTELSKCQKYLRFMGAGLSGVFYDNSTLSIYGTLEPPMFSAPTVSIVSGTTSIRTVGIESGKPSLTAKNPSITSMNISKDGYGFIGIGGFTGATSGDVASCVVQENWLMLSCEPL